MRRIVAVVLVTLLGAGVFGTARAAPIVTFAYTAVAQFPVGPGTVAGTFGYDLAVSDSDPGPNRAVYLGAGFITGTVTGGAQDGIVFDLQGLDVRVFRAAPLTELFIGDIRPTFEATGVYLSKLGTPFALPNTDLPLDLDLGDFSFGHHIGLHPDQVGGPPPPSPAGQFLYVISTLTLLQPAPEPSTLLLVGVALLAVIGTARATGGLTVRLAGA